MPKKYTVNQLDAMTEELADKISNMDDLSNLAQDEDFTNVVHILMDQDTDTIMQLLGKAVMEANDITIEGLSDQDG